MEDAEISGGIPVVPDRPRPLLDDRCSAPLRVLKSTIRMLEMGKESRASADDRSIGRSDEGSTILGTSPDTP
jgi:hypothetical protein